MDWAGVARNLREGLFTTVTTVTAVLVRLVFRPTARYTGASKVKGCHAARPLKNISAGGCFVETEDPSPKGAIVTAVLTTGGPTVKVLGEVRFCDPRKGLGIRFTNIERES